jgi:hypothetical protein
MREESAGGLQLPGPEAASFATVAGLSFDTIVLPDSFEEGDRVHFSDDDFHFHNAGTCPECGGGMVRSGACFSCPVCGFGSCGG